MFLLWKHNSPCYKLGCHTYYLPYVAIICFEFVYDLIHHKNYNTFSSVSWQQLDQKHKEGLERAMQNPQILLIKVLLWIK